MNTETITLPDGRVFPQYDGEVLSWSPGLYHTYAEERAGFPRMRAVLRAMLAQRPDQFEREYLEMIKSSFDRIFGHVARQAIIVMEQVAEERSRRPTLLLLHGPCSFLWRLLSLRSFGWHGRYLGGHANDWPLRML